MNESGERKYTTRREVFCIAGERENYLRNREYNQKKRVKMYIHKIIYKRGVFAGNSIFFMK